VKAIACALPAEQGLPLSRLSISEIASLAVEKGIVETISPGTVWRWLEEDALRPWFHRPWLFCPDPDFAEKAGRVLDLYQGLWQGEPLSADDYVFCADEKTQIQLLCRKGRILPPRPRQVMRFENSYERLGTVVYLAALDVFSGRVFGKVEKRNGIRPFNRLVKQVMEQEPYRSARRVFWVVDNGPAHHPSTFPRRLKEMYPNAIAVHLPIHASWLNQIELYFSILQRKALTPVDFADVQEATERILGFEQRYNRTAAPFSWNFSRDKLGKRLKLLA